MHAFCHTDHFSLVQPILAASGSLLRNGLLLLAVLAVVAVWWMLVKLKKARMPKPPADGDEDNDEPIRSLVLLLDAPREIKDDAWITHLGEALGISLGSGDGDSVNFVLPMPHPVLTPQGDDCFMLKIPCGVFWIFHVKRPYFEDIKGWAGRMSDQRLREAVEGHHAWISVDLLTWLEGPPDRARIYDMIGKVVAALAGPDVRVVFSPELERANEFDLSLLPRLAGGDPLALFKEPTFAPVINASDDDEKMQAAIHEARRRWPEFVGYFNARDPGSERPFIVKAPFTCGEHTEHMWMLVTGIDGDRIHGTLANQPHHLVDYHEGQTVAVAAEELTDWLCADGDDKPLGGWSQKVLTANRSGKSRD
jgi:uncharacterized protein YegJ (DUF2314 family)